MGSLFVQHVFATTTTTGGVFDGLYTLLDYVLNGIAAVGIFFVVLGAVEIAIAISQGTRDLPSMKNAIFAIAAGFICISIKIIVNAMGVTW